MRKIVGGRGAASCVEDGAPASRPALSGIEGLVIIVVLLSGTVLSTLGQPAVLVLELLGGLTYTAVRLVATSRACGARLSVQG
ncbi:hypothetical protein [Kitasatospora kifunensis]|uniref:Uncharacterized protein n=1 Tax=Kitasatospora kifunensis TaxID=58351 RepID=A0A7W7RBF2_KITKI|nr:hypothetical protein [Kitasatospora kifunensis]MBB4928839.1 hypothetical protein [Kitasatospora kifunensis]